MSSTLSQPRTRKTTAPTVAPAATAVRPDDLARDEEDFRQFVRAICLGTAIGFPTVMALMIGLVRVAAPEWEFWPAVGIGLWVSIWTGMFLGGTITVGLWSNRHHG